MFPFRQISRLLQASPREKRSNGDPRHLSREDTSSLFGRRKLLGFRGSSAILENEVHCVHLFFRLRILA
jgi:hypothetical protein